MPDIVKICFESLKRVVGNHPIFLIHKDNWQEIVSKITADNNNSTFLKWREDIVDMIDRGKMTITTFSDVLRSWLLYNNGGIWVDSTILFMKTPIDDIIGRTSFWSRRLEVGKYENHFVAKNRWAVFIFASVKRNPLFKYIHMGILKIVDKYGKVYEYFTIDYIMAIFYRENKWFSNFIDSLPENKKPEFDYNLNEAYNSDYYQNTIKHYPFYKLSWKNDYYDTDRSGNMTYYGYLKKSIKADGKE